jgi:hypothetical protein
VVELLRREPHLSLQRRGVVDDGALLRGYAAHGHQRFDVVDGEKDLLQKLCGGEHLSGGRLAGLYDGRLEGLIERGGGLGGGVFVLGSLGVD